MAGTQHLTGEDIRDLMAQSIEARFGKTHTPHSVEWLSDNGAPYMAHETRRFGTQCGLVMRNTPSYSPEFNGMAEAFVKTFKRDFLYLADLRDAETALRQLPEWFHQYNEHHPHKGLKMLAPCEYRHLQAS